jgi:hypothetical protein
LYQAATENKAEYNYLSALLNSENTSQTSSYSLHSIFRMSVNKVQHDLLEDTATSVLTRRGKGSLETLEIPKTESKLFFSISNFSLSRHFQMNVALQLRILFPELLKEEY